VDKDETKLLPPDLNEPENIAKLSNKLELKHIVITTVTRDDLPDGGAEHFAEVVRQIRKHCKSNVTIELLISDLEGNNDALKIIMAEKPDVLNHNIETVPRLYGEVRPMANYQRSLTVLKQAAEFNPETTTKSGIMVGLGESEPEVIQVMKDLRNVGCEILTIGQYLAPTKKHLPVIEYVHPEIFEKYRKIGEELGFMFVESGPLVRSSYHAKRVQDYK